MCYSAVLIFQSLNAAERRELCQFMRANRFITLDTAVRALFDVYIVNGEDFIVPRVLLPLPFPMPIALPGDDEVLPF